MSEELAAQWGILELMGHKVVAGLLSNIGHPLVRIDVPETTARGAFTQFYGQDAIYAITLTSEEVARKCAEDYRVDPISVYAPSLIDKEKFDAAMEKIAELRAENHKLIAPNDEDLDDDDVPF